MHTHWARHPAIKLGTRSYCNPSRTANFKPEDRYDGGKIREGHWAELTKSFSAEDVKHFAELSLDRNPVHLNEEYASGTMFKHCIVHGFLTGSLISAIAGQILPGPGTIYLKQSMNFRRPVYIGEPVTARVQSIDKETKRAQFFTACYNKDQRVVIEGEALALVPEDKL